MVFDLLLWTVGTLHVTVHPSAVFAGHTSCYVAHVYCTSVDTLHVTLRTTTPKLSPLNFFQSESHFSIAIDFCLKINRFNVFSVGCKSIEFTPKINRNRKKKSIGKRLKFNRNYDEKSIGLSFKIQQKFAINFRGRIMVISVFNFLCGREMQKRSGNKMKK